MNAPAHIGLASAYRQLRSAEKAFVDAYVADIEREAERTGAKVSAWLWRAIPSDAVEASRGMLGKPLVLAAITERISEIAAANELSVRRVVQEIMSVAFSNMEDYVTVGEDGRPSFDLANLTREQWAAVQQIDIEYDPRNANVVRSFKVKLHPKMTGIDMLARYTGMLETDNPHWKSEGMRPANSNVAALPNSITAEGAGDRYSAMING